MAGSTLLRKSITDLTRRRARSLFAAATLALAVASVSILAAPRLMERAMRGEVAASRLADLTLSTAALPLSAAQLDGLRRLPNVLGLEPRSYYATRVYVGERRAPALVVGVPDFPRQAADIVRVASGTVPRGDAVLTEVQNARQGVFGGRVGTAARVVAADGSERSLPIVGEGRSLGGGRIVTDDERIVLYATPRTVAALSGRAGFATLALRLRDRSPAAADRTARAVAGFLATRTAFTGYADIPERRAPGTWPGKADFEKLAKFMNVVTALALLSALVLIASTMSTLVAEQTGEIGTMKAIGGTRRQIAGVFVRTAVLLGALGALVGSLGGVVLVNAIVAAFGSDFYGIDPGFAIDVPVLLGGLALGVIGPAAAALPAIRRGVRLPVREAVGAVGADLAQEGRLDRVLRRLRFLPRTVQIGLRGVGRRKRRSLVTTLQVALAVGNLLAVMGIARAAADTSRSSWGDRRWAFSVGAGLRQPLDARAARLIRATPGVASAEPVLVNEARLAGEDAFTWGTRARTRLRYRMASGRWYTAAEERARAPVAVVERNLARATGTQVGETIRVTTGSGPATFRVIGIARNQQEDGTVVFVPLATLRAVLRADAGVTGYWVRAASNDHRLIDRTTTRVEDALTAAGYAFGTEITYVAERDEVASNRNLTTTIALLGFVVVAISMVGLINEITMSVLQRTREIGVLRCIGARARDIRRIFTAEGLTLAAAGWLVGIPFGYALDRFLVWLVREVVKVEIPFVFPAVNVALALAGTVVIALLVIAMPVRRGVRLRPGEALRYA